MEKSTPSRSSQPPALPPKSSSSTRINFYNVTHQEMKPGGKTPMTEMIGSTPPSAQRPTVASETTNIPEHSTIGIAKLPTNLSKLTFSENHEKPQQNTIPTKKQRTPSLSTSLSSSASSSSCSPPVQSAVRATPPFPSQKSSSSKMLSDLARILNNSESSSTANQSRNNHPQRSDNSTQPTYKSNYKCPPDKEIQAIKSVTCSQQQQPHVSVQPNKHVNPTLTSDIYNADIDYMNTYLKSLPDYSELDKKIHKEFKKCEDLYDQIKSINSGIVAQKNQLAKSTSHQSIGSGFGAVGDVSHSGLSTQNKLSRSISSTTMPNQNFPLDHPEIRGFLPKLEKFGVSESSFGVKKGVQKSASNSCINLRPMGKQLMNAFWSNNINGKDQKKSGWNYEKIIAATPTKETSAPRFEPEPVKLQKNMSLPQLNCKSINQNQKGSIQALQPSSKCGQAYPQQPQQLAQCQPPGFMNLSKSISYSNVPQGIKSSSKTSIPCYAKPTISTLNKSCSNGHLPMIRPSTAGGPFSNQGPPSKNVMKSSSSSSIFSAKQTNQPFFLRRKEASNVQLAPNVKQIATRNTDSVKSTCQQQINHKPQEAVTSYICNIFKRPVVPGHKDSGNGGFVSNENKAVINVGKQGPKTLPSKQQTQQATSIEMAATKKQKNAENHFEKRLNDILRITANFNQQSKEKNAFPIKKSNSTSAVPQTSIFRQPHQQAQAQRFVKRPIDAKNIGLKIGGGTHQTTEQSQVNSAIVTKNESQTHQYQSAPGPTPDATNVHDKTRPSNAAITYSSKGLNKSNGVNVTNNGSKMVTKYLASGQTPTGATTTPLSTFTCAAASSNSDEVSVAQKRPQVNKTSCGTTGNNQRALNQGELKGNDHKGGNNNPYYDDNMRTDILRTFDPYFYPKPKQHQQQNQGKGLPQAMPQLQQTLQCGTHQQQAQLQLQSLQQQLQPAPLNQSLPMGFGCHQPPQQPFPPTSNHQRANNNNFNSIQIFEVDFICKI